MGEVAGRFGSRNSQSAMYAGLVPPLHDDPDAQQTTGGLFWDGRVDSLEEQANGPLMNPLEMANPSKQVVIDKLRLGPNADADADAFRAAFGADSLDDVDRAYDHMIAALTAFERTPTLAPFASKYDRYLVGRASLDASEQRGLATFEDPARGNCANCHPNRPGADGAPPMFTNYRYANLGIPAYANNLFYVQPAPLNPDGAKYVDRGLGLGRTLDDPREDGKFRTPMLRNIARTATYGHNGYFANLSYFVDSLNTRDIGSEQVGSCSRVAPHTSCAWPAPEIAATMDHRVGSLHRSEPDVADLVAFLNTLDDVQ